jgi:hypothetical protein
MHALALLACAEPPPPADPCNHTYDTSAREVDATYVPYNWCNDIQSEADAIHGTYTCTGDALDGETVSLTVEPPGPIEDSLIVIGVEATDIRVEVVAWYVDLTFASDAFALFVPSMLEIYEFGDGDRTVLFNGMYARYAIDGWLLEGVEEDQQIDVFSATPVGEPDKVWTVFIGPYDERMELSCE